MEAIGLIETRGLLAAIEAVDTMTKSADVSIVEKTYVGGGLVTVIVTGDVGAVKAAIEAGGAAVKNINPEYLISENIMARPHQELESIIGPKTTVEVLEVSSTDEDLEIIEEIEEEVIEVVQPIEILEETKVKVEQTDLDKINKTNLQNLHKNDVDNLVNENGIEKTILTLSKLKVVKLRNLAREYEDFIITGRAISKADKKLLIGKFKAYYEKK
ncbi:MAG: BMC domain-containing protein [Clostridium sp.]